MSLVNNMLRDLEQQLDCNGLSALSDIKPTACVTKDSKKINALKKSLLFLGAAIAATMFFASNYSHISGQQIVSTPLVLPPAMMTRLAKIEPYSQQALTAQPKLKSKRSQPALPSKKSSAKKNQAVKLKQSVINIKRSGSLAQLNYQKATKLISNKQTEAATKLLTNTLKINPGHLDTVDLYGELLLSSGQYDKAITIADSGLQIKPGYLPFVFIKAQAFIQQGQLSDARDLLEEKKQYAARNVVYLNLQASVYRQMKEFKLALAIYKDAIKINPASSSLWTGLAISLDAIGETAAAQRAYHYISEMPSSKPELRHFALERIRIAGL